MSQVDEYVPEGTKPTEAVMMLAEQKAEAVAKQLMGQDALVIGADTVVVLDDRILGKPRDEAEAVNMLTSLQGRRHEVLSGICVIDVQGHRRLSDFGRTTVQVQPMTPAQIEAYVQTKEPVDKAGAYAIQGKFARYIERIEGCYYNVMGLPLNLLVKKIHALGMDI